MKAVIEKPVKPQNPRRKKVIVKDGEIVDPPKPVEAEKPVKEIKAKAEKPDNPYRRPTWSRNTLEHTIPAKVRDAALKEFGYVLRDKTFAMKVIWDDGQKAIMTIMVPIAETGFKEKKQ